MCVCVCVCVCDVDILFTTIFGLCCIPFIGQYWKQRNLANYFSDTFERHLRRTTGCHYCMNCLLLTRSPGQWVLESEGAIPTQFEQITMIRCVRLHSAWQSSSSSSVWSYSVLPPGFRLVLFSLFVFIKCWYLVVLSSVWYLCSSTLNRLGMHDKWTWWRKSQLFKCYGVWVSWV